MTASIAEGLCYILDAEGSRGGPAEELMERPFAKYEGLGNDFVVIDAREWPASMVGPALAMELCDRHRGVGADGVLWVTVTGAAAATLVIYNADGTRPEMCGNGVRCVAAFLADRGELAAGQQLALETDAGPRPVRLVDRAGGQWLSSVDMGSIVADAAPFATVTAGDDSAHVFFADAGNPHAVLFSPPPDRASREALASAVRLRADRYPHGVNVEFVTERDDGTLRASVHERGVGWTLACGTGACAVAAVRAARANTARADTRVELDGGTLSIEVTREGDGRFRAVMTGPARRAFAGAVEPSRGGAPSR